MTREASTKDLIRKAQTGDRKAFDQVAAHYYEELGTFVASRLGAALRARIEIEDIVQETFLKAFRSLPSFTWQGQRSFFQWLAGIANNLIRNLGRRSRLEKRFALRQDFPGDADSPSKNLRREERFDRLQAALQALSPDHRQVIMMTRVEGLPLEEVANRMNRSPKATRQLLWRALQNLRDQFGDTESYHLPDRPLRRTGAKDE